VPSREPNRFLRVPSSSARAARACACADQLASDAWLVGGRNDVQRGVAGVHVVVDLVEEMLLGAVPGGTDLEACQRELGLTGRVASCERRLSYGAECLGW
jgi:hypothetical protein